MVVGASRSERTKLGKSALQAALRTPTIWEHVVTAPAPLPSVRQEQTRRTWDGVRRPNHSPSSGTPTALISSPNMSCSCSDRPAQEPSHVLQSLRVHSGAFVRALRAFGCGWAWAPAESRPDSADYQPPSMPRSAVRAFSALASLLLGQRDNGVARGRRVGVRRRRGGVRSALPRILPARQPRAKESAQPAPSMHSNGDSIAHASAATITGAAGDRSEAEEVTQASAAATTTSLELHQYTTTLASCSSTTPA